MSKAIIYAMLPLVLSAWSSSGHALVFDWEFLIGPFSRSDYTPGDVISGTISGLEEGVNDGSGLTVIVDPTPAGTVLDQDWIFLLPESGPTAFLVTDGLLVEADAYFVDTTGDKALFMGTNPWIGGGDTWVPSLGILSTNEHYSSCDLQVTQCAATVFTSSVTIPLPSTLLLFGMALFGILYRPGWRRE